MGCVTETTPVGTSYIAEEGDEEVIPGLLYLKRDGTSVKPVTGLTQRLPANADFVDGVASKDILVDNKSGVRGRIFMPESVAKRSDVKVPVVAFYHGGGFVLGAVDAPLSMAQCVMTARISEVVVVSFSYRLGPEHRLPAAYEDAYTSVLWLQEQAALQAKGEGEPWLSKHADFSKCYLMGDSAGGNMVHHVSGRISNLDLSPLAIDGLILLLPWFSKQERTESEKLYGDFEPVLPLEMTDRFWDLSLPIGANRDHPYSNVFSPDAPSLTEVQFSRMLIIIAEKDHISSCQREYYDAIKNAGRNVEIVEVLEAGHNFRMYPQFQSQALRCEQAIRTFIYDDGASS